MKLERLIGLTMRVSSPPALNKAGGASAAGTEQSPQSKWLRKWQGAFLRQQPAKSIESSTRQAAAHKVALLKQRLEALKALLRFASPEMAKRLASELKNIAGELASVAKSLGSSSGGAAPSAAVAVPAEGGQSADAQAEDIDAAAAEATAAAATDTEGEEEGEAVSAAAIADDSPEPQGADGDDDSGLKALLRDARKLLKEVIDLMKAKLAHAKGEAKRDLDAAEKGLADLDKALSQADASPFYTSTGNIGGADPTSASSGILVDLTA